MSFLETPRFPDDVALEFEGGGGYLTRIAQFPATESRNAMRSASRGRWTATHQHKSQALTDALIAMFHACLGRTHGFRFFDGTDFKAAAGTTGVVTLVSGTTYQLYKRYTAGALTRDRLIAKPVASTVTIAGGGSYTLDATTGRFTHDSGAAPSGWTGEFDVPCRFDSDQQQIRIVRGAVRAGAAIFTWGDIQIVEIPV